MKVVERKQELVIEIDQSSMATNGSNIQEAGFPDKPGKINLIAVLAHPGGQEQERRAKM